MTDTKTYRHAVTGLVGQFPPNVAEALPGVLIEVEHGAKPLAYVPIEPEAVAAVIEADPPSASLNFFKKAK